MDDHPTWRREAVRMFLRGSFYLCFLPGLQCGPSWAIWCPAQKFTGDLQAVLPGRAAAPGILCERCAVCKPAKALSRKVFSEVVDLASGDVVQLVRTLP